MTYRWLDSYQNLKNYLGSNSEIVIEASSVFMPEEKRGQFYQYFDATREAFLRQFFSTELVLAQELKNEFATAEQLTTSAMGIAGEVKMAAHLRWFLNDPVNGLMRLLLNPLFDLLKGKTDEKLFEEFSIEEVRKAFSKYYRTGYERWAILCLLKWLEPAKAITLPLHDLDLFSSSGGGDSQLERNEILPDTQPLKELKFDVSVHISFAVPEVIVYSSRLGKYVAIKAGFVEPIWKARFVSEDRKWLDLKPLAQVFTANNPWPNIMLYIDDYIENINLAGDRYRLCQPDLIINTLPENDWFSTPDIPRLQAQAGLIEPPAGCIAISRINAPEEIVAALGGQKVETSQPEETPVEEPAPSVRVVAVGYDCSKLTSAIGKMLVPRQDENLPSGDENEES